MNEEINEKRQGYNDKQPGEIEEEFSDIKRESETIRENKPQKKISPYGASHDHEDISFKPTLYFYLIYPRRDDLAIKDRIEESELSLTLDKFFRGKRTLERTLEGTKYLPPSFEIYIWTRRQLSQNELRELNREISPFNYYCTKQSHITDLSQIRSNR